MTSSTPSGAGPNSKKELNGSRSSEWGRKGQRVLVAALCLLLVAPPVHWLVGQGDRLVSISYFIGSGVLIVVVLYLIARQERTVKTTARTSRTGA